ncbi:MAG: ribose transport system permease protein [Solirubrobacteraceae bacterium]|nr:ribose transport system permease protein [Solirubrobacteraceae bacterium]
MKSTESEEVGGRSKRSPTGVLGRSSQTTAGGLVALIAITWVIYGTIGNGFLSSFNLFTLSQLAAQTAVLGFAQLAVLALGRMNLAVGAVGVCVTMFTAWLIGVKHVDPILGIAAGLVLGAALGALMGWIELKTKLNSFIVTLAMASVYTGLMLLLSNGDPVGNIPTSIASFGANSMFTPYLSFLVIPTLVVAGGAWYLYRRTSLGWKMLAVGANETAAGLSGVRVSRVVIIGFGLSGLLCGVAGIMEMARVATALPSQGGTWLLAAFIVPVLGGNSLRGGSVAIGGALLAAIFLESINSGLVSLDVAVYWRELAQAAVLLIAVMADEARRRRQRNAKVERMVQAEAARRSEGAHATA